MSDKVQLAADEISSLLIRMVTTHGKQRAVEWLHEEWNRQPEALFDAFIMPPDPAAAVAPEQLAQRFHETYERLAPHFGYETRPESAKPWAEVPEQNRRLMVAVCAVILGGLRGVPAASVAPEPSEIHVPSPLVVENIRDLLTAADCETTDE